MDLGPKGYPILWKAEDLGLSHWVSPYTQACRRRLPSRGAGAGAKEIYFFLDPVIFRNYKDSWNFFTNEM